MSKLIKFINERGPFDTQDEAISTLDFDSLDVGAKFRIAGRNYELIDNGGEPGFVEVEDE